MGVVSARFLRRTAFPVFIFVIVIQVFEDGLFWFRSEKSQDLKKYSQSDSQKEGMIVEVEEGVAQPAKDSSGLEARLLLATYFVDAVRRLVVLIHEDDQVEVAEELLRLGSHRTRVHAHFHHRIKHFDAVQRCFGALKKRYVFERIMDYLCPTFLPLLPGGMRNWDEVLLVT
jgi:hypothetical protein